MTRPSTQVEVELRNFFKSKGINVKIQWESTGIRLKFPGTNYYSKGFPTVEFNTLVAPDYDYKVISNVIVVIKIEK